MVLVGFRRGAVCIALASLALLLWASPGRAAFPGSNGKIAYNHCADDGCSVWTMDADGGNAARLVSGAGDPAFSADGQKIAYTQCPLGEGCALMVANADGSDPVQVTTATAGDGGLGDAAFSPDGKTIVFSRCTIVFVTCRILSVSSSGGAAT